MAYIAAFVHHIRDEVTNPNAFVFILTWGYIMKHKGKNNNRYGWWNLCPVTKAFNS